MAVRTAAVALLATLALAACQRGADSGATANPNAPGSPGDAAVARQAAPQRSDGPPGGSAGAKGSVPHPGSSGGDAVVGTSGRGTSEPGSRSTEAATPGSGLNGGLGGSTGNTGTMGAGPQARSVPQGGTNRSNDSTTGFR
jgi:hypothetical protein